MKGISMTSGAPWKHILRFALPVMAGSLLQQLYNTADTIIVGKFVGEDALSAVGTTGTLVFLFLAIAMGFSQGNGVVVAQHYGAEDEEKVRNDASSGILFLTLLGIICALLGITLINPAAKYVLAVPEELISMSVVYFRIYSVGILFQFGYNSFSAILRAVGDSACTLYFLLISSVLNIALDLIFVIVFKWGIVGAAVATDISQLCSCAAAYIYMQKKYPTFRFKRGQFVWKHEAVKKTVHIGLPIALQLVIVSFGLTFIQRAVNEFGKAMTASFTVGMRVEQYINMPSGSIQSTIATYTGQNVGAGKMDRVKKGLAQAMLMCFIMIATVSTLVFVFAQDIVTLFGLGSEAAAYCVRHLRGIAVVNAILCLYFPAFGVYHGTGHSLVATVIAVIVLGIRVAVVYLLRYSAFFGCSIIWWNGLFGFTIGFIIAWGYFFSGRWQIINGQKPVKK